MPLLAPEVLEKVNRRVYRRFPEVRGSKPRLRREGEYIRLTYRGKGLTADGHVLPRQVRVLVTPGGRILKMTTSH